MQFSVSDEKDSNTELQDKGDISDSQEENEVPTKQDQDENEELTNQIQEKSEVPDTYDQLEKEVKTYHDQEESKNDGDMQIYQMNGENQTQNPSTKGLFLRRPCITRKAAMVKTNFRFASVSNQTNRFYGQGCPGIQVRAVPVMIFTVSFMFLIIFLHLWTKFYYKKVK